MWLNFFWLKLCVSNVWMPSERLLAAHVLLHVTRLQLGTKHQHFIEFPMSPLTPQISSRASGCMLVPSALFCFVWSVFLGMVVDIRVKGLFACPVFEKFVFSPHIHCQKVFWLSKFTVSVSPNIDPIQRVKCNHRPTLEYERRNNPYLVVKL